MAIAKGFGCGGRFVKREVANWPTPCNEMIDYDGPFVLDVQVPYQEHVLPMIPVGQDRASDLIKE